MYPSRRNILFLSICAFCLVSLSVVINFHNRTGDVFSWVEEKIEIEAYDGFAFAAIPEKRVPRQYLLMDGVEIREDSKPLGPLSSDLQDVVVKGLGVSALVKDTVFFSTSDNTNPVVNGRSYSLFRPAVVPYAVVISIYVLSVVSVMAFAISIALYLLGPQKMGSANGKLIESIRWSIGIVPKLLISLFIAAGLAMAAEVGFRAFGPTHNEGTLIGFEMFPYRDYIVSTHPENLELGNSDSLLERYFLHGNCDDNGVTARFNSQGFRSPEFPGATSKNEDELRVMVTGGSAALSFGIGERCTLDTLLHDRLREIIPDKKVRIFNVSSGGWKSVQEWIAAGIFRRDINPDLVIQFSGSNDVDHSFFWDYRKSYINGQITSALQFHRNWASGGVSEFFNSFRIVEYLRRKSAGTVSLHGGHEATETKPKTLPIVASAPTPGQLGTQPVPNPDVETIMSREDFDPYGQQVVDFFLDNSRKLAGLFVDDDIPVITILQPSLYLKKPMSAFEEEIAFGRYGERMNYNALGYFRIRMLGPIMASENDFHHFVDLSAVFSGHSGTMFSDNVHMTPAGYRILAEKIGSVVKDVLEQHE